MLFLDTTEPKTLSLLKQLQTLPILANTRLVGCHISSICEDFTSAPFISHCTDQFQFHFTSVFTDTIRTARPNLPRENQIFATVAAHRLDTL